MPAAKETPLDDELLQDVLPSNSDDATSWAHLKNPQATPGDVHPFHKETGWQEWREALPKALEDQLWILLHFCPSINQLHNAIYQGILGYMQTVLETCIPDNRIMRENVNQSRM